MSLRALARPPIRFGRTPLPIVALWLTLAGQLTVGGRATAWLGALLLAAGGLLIGIAALRATRGAARVSAESLVAADDAVSAADRPPDGLIGGRLGLGVLLLV